MSRRPTAPIRLRITTDKQIWFEVEDRATGQGVAQLLEACWNDLGKGEPSGWRSN